LLARSLVYSLAPLTGLRRWSRNTRKLLTGSSKGELVLWDVLSGAAEHTRAMGHAVTSVSLHPRTPTLALVSLADAEPQLLDLAKARAATVAWEPDGPQPLLGERCVAAMFAHSGERIFACTSKGTVCAYAIRDGELKREAGLTSLASTKVRASSLTLSPRRALPRHVVAFDRSLRLFDAETLQPRRELSDVVNRVVWRQAQFSPHGELVYGAVASSTQHKIFVWRRADGRLERTLDEPRDGMSDLVAHPLRPVLVSVGRSGVLYVWGKRYAENWSAFAADFRLLEENQEYEEREDEVSDSV
jgi:COMPASS component SWD1